MPSRLQRIGARYATVAVICFNIIVLFAMIDVTAALIERARPPQSDTLLEQSQHWTQRFNEFGLSLDRLHRPDPASGQTAS